GRSRWLVLAGHVGLGLMLILLAGVFVMTGSWLPGALFGTLGVVAIAAPALARAPRGTATRSDLFTIAVGVAIGLVGVAMLAVPHLFAPAALDWMRPYQQLYGATYAVSGALVVVTQLHARARWWVRWPAALLLVGLVLLPILGR